jgi:hypothetical protein
MPAVNNIPTKKLAEEIADQFKKVCTTVTVKKQKNGKWRVVASGCR